MRFAALLTIAAFAAPAFAQQASPSGERTVVEREGYSSIVNFRKGDPALVGAMDEARRRLDYFWARARSPAPNEGAWTLKVGFLISAADAHTEHIWVDTIHRTRSGWSARLANEPNWMEGKHLGDEVIFTDDMISDWGFYRDGKMIGYYTVRIALDDLPKDEADHIRSRLGENPR